MSEHTPQEDFVEKLQAGDPEAYSILIDKYQKLLFKIAYNILKDTEAAGDTTQETFIKVYQQRHRIDAKGNLRAWMCRIAVNKALNFLSRRKARAEESGDFSDQNSVAQQESREKLPDDTAIAKELHVVLEEALHSLPPQQRAASVLHYIEEIPVAEVAIILGISEGSVKTHLSHSRRKMADLLGKYHKDS